jgi:hypothetical protein
MTSTIEAKGDKSILASRKTPKIEKQTLKTHQAIKTSSKEKIRCSVPPKKQPLIVKQLYAYLAKLG